MKAPDYYWPIVIVLLLAGLALFRDHGVMDRLIAVVLGVMR